MKLNVFIIGLMFLASVSTFSRAEETKEDFWHSDNCPTKTSWVDEAGNPLTFDQKFGTGTQEVTRCLGKTKKVKVVYQVDGLCSDDTCNEPFGFGHIMGHIRDYKEHGMTADDYEIVVVIYGPGSKLVLDNHAEKKHPSLNNPFQSQMEELVNQPGVKVLYCMRSADLRGIVKANMIKGIGFVTASISAITDLQEEGYRYLHQR